MHNYTKFDPTNPPPPLMTGEPDSFANRTMTTRKPTVIRNILNDYGSRYPAAFKLALQALHDEVIEDKVIQPLKTAAPDGPDWTRAWQPYQNSTWLNCPWYFAEAFLYRRILEAVDYFGHGKWAGIDPYLPRKPTLQGGFARSQLLIFKGDANYRRLVGDSRWPATVPIADIVPYLPAPFITLRMMKSDPVVRLQPGQAEALDVEDPDWRVNGKRGMIQAHL